MKRPNILFLMTDEQRHDTFSFNNSVMKTPNLDVLIKESVFFDNAYCSNPSCVPSRAAIVTGKFPTQCACPTFITKLPKEETTYMAKLQEVGYYTAVVGKQHFAHSEIYRGHDYECIIDGHSPNATPSEIVPYTEHLKGKNIKELYKAHLICGGSWIGDISDHIDSFVGDKGCEVLSDIIGQKMEKPWYMTISFPGPHQPYDCENTEYADLYELDDIKVANSTYKDLEQKPPHYYKLNPKHYTNLYDEEKFKKTKRSYYANMSLIDSKIGKIIDMLKEKGEYDNTVIIYSTDHGDFMGDFGMVTKAQYLSEGLMHIPLFVKPAIKDFEGFVCSDLVTNINIASTCLTLAGATHEITQDMENHPYNTYWENGKDDNALPYVYMEAHDLKGIIEDNIKVIYYVERDYGELYNLKDDPDERVNLWDDTRYQTAKMRAMARIIDKMFRMSPKNTTQWNINAPEI